MLIQNLRATDLDHLFELDHTWVAGTQRLQVEEVTERHPLEAIVGLSALKAQSPLDDSNGLNDVKWLTFQTLFVVVLHVCMPFPSKIPAPNGLKPCRRSSESHF